MLDIERHPFTDRNIWLQLRHADYVTASNTGALYGVHPYMTALGLYVRARGVEFPDEDNAVLRRGRWLEPSIKKAVEEQRPDWKLIQNEHYYRVPEIKFGGTPDFLIEGDPRGLGVLQGKTAAPEIFANDWEHGAALPQWIRLQVLTEALLTGADFATVAVLTVDPYRMVCPIIEVPFTQADFDDIIARARQFKADVEAGREPAPDFEKDAELIKTMAPRELPGNVLDLSGDNEIPILLSRRAELQEHIKAEKAECEVIETELRYRMGAAEKIIGVPGWNVSYKTTDFKEYTVPARSNRVLRINARRTDARV